MPAMRVIRLFVSSPSDVFEERQRIKWITDRLNGEFAQILRFEAILWEREVYHAHESFQEQIDKRARPADCDIVLAVFWSRLGTPLLNFTEKRADGKCYPVTMPDGK